MALTSLVPSSSLKTVSTFLLKKSLALWYHACKKRKLELLSPQIPKKSNACVLQGPVCSSLKMNDLNKGHT